VPFLCYKEQSVNSVHWTGFCYVIVCVSYKYTVCTMCRYVCYVKKALHVLTAVVCTKAWISWFALPSFLILCIPHFKSIKFFFLWKLYCSFLSLICSVRQQRTETLPKYSKRNRKLDAVISYEVRTPHRTFTFWTDREVNRLMENLQLNVKKDSYNFDNTPLHVGLYFFFGGGGIRILIAGKNTRFFCVI
jgi:hypothetical protein